MYLCMYVYRDTDIVALRKFHIVALRKFDMYLCMYVYRDTDIVALRKFLLEILNDFFEAVPQISIAPKHNVIKLSHPYIHTYTHTYLPRGFTCIYSSKKQRHKAVLVLLSGGAIVLFQCRSEEG
jgi:hypothetical protein